MPSITHIQLKAIREAFSQIVDCDEDGHALEWLDDIISQTSANPNWPHETTMKPETSVSGYNPGLGDDT